MVSDNARGRSLRALSVHHRGNLLVSCENRPPLILGPAGPKILTLWAPWALLLLTEWAPREPYNINNMGPPAGQDCPSFFYICFISLLPRIYTCIYYAILFVCRTSLTSKQSTTWDNGTINWAVAKVQRGGPFTQVGPILLILWVPQGPKILHRYTWLPRE